MELMMVSRLLYGFNSGELRGVGARIPVVMGLSGVGAWIRGCSVPVETGVGV